jgi:putative acetyltransferase
MTEIRRERSSDIDAIRAVVEAAFPTKAEAVLVEALRAAGDAVVSAVAVENGTVLGHAMLSKMGGPFPIVGLAPVAVLPARQKQGIGSRVVTYALGLARESGWIGAFVLGAPTFYGRFGFSVDLARGFQSPYAGSHFMALALNGSLPLSAGQVDYAPAFAQLG